MALADFALRAAGLRARPPAPRSAAPPRGALESPGFYGTPGQPLWPSFDPQTAIRIGERNIFAMRCVEVVANSISGLPYQAGNVKSRVARPTTRQMQLLGPAPGRPNPKWSSAKLWRYSVIQYLMTGKYAWLNEFDDAGRVVALWPLMAQHLTPILAEPGSGDYFKGYRYGTRGSRGYREFKLDEVRYCWRPSQEDFRQPEPPMRLAQWGIQVLKLIDEFDRAFLANGGVPTHMVITPPFEKNDERVAFRDQFRTKFGGARNAGKPAFAEFTDEPGDYGQGTGAAGRQTVDVKTIGLSQKDSQLRESRMDRIDEMCAALGVPLSLLGISRDSKFTNMQTDKEVLWQITNKPIITELEDNTNTALSDLDGPLDVGWFDLSGVPELRKPPVFSETEGLAAVAAGAITENEYRIDRGLPPKEGGDEYRTPAAPPAAVPPQLENGSPDAPPADQPPPKLKVVRAAAVRTDLLGVVRDQLAVELTAQRRELEARRDGKRGGRRRAHASLDLGLVYDVEHWQRRAVTNLGPGLRAAGYDDAAVEQFSHDITAVVADQLAGETDIGAIEWEPDGYLTQLNRPAAMLPVGDVERALLQLATGNGEAAAALSALGGGG